jgi:hypothetical protein
MSLGPEHKKRVIDNARDSIFDAIVPLCGVLFFGWNSTIVIAMLFLQVYIIGIVDFIFHIYSHYKKNNLKAFFAQSILGFLEICLVLSFSTLIFLFLVVFILSYLADIQWNIVDTHLYYSGILAVINQIIISALAFGVIYIVKKIKAPKKVYLIKFSRVFFGDFLSKNTLIHFIYYTTGVYVGALVFPIIYNFLMRYMYFLPNITAQGCGSMMVFGVVFVAIVYHGIMILDSIFSDVKYVNR